MQDTAQRAMVAYLRSVFLQPNRAVFDASVLPVEDLALSMGLSTVPRLRFLARTAQPADGGAGTADVAAVGCPIARKGLHVVSLHSSLLMLLCSACVSPCCDSKLD